MNSVWKRFLGPLIVGLGILSIWTDRAEAHRWRAFATYPRRVRPYAVRPWYYGSGVAVVGPRVRVYVARPVPPAVVVPRYRYIPAPRIVPPPVVAPGPVPHYYIWE